MNIRQFGISRAWTLTIVGWLAAFTLLLLVTGDRREPVTVPTDSPPVNVSATIETAGNTETP